MSKRNSIDDNLKRIVRKKVLKNYPRHSTTEYPDHAPEFLEGRRAFVEEWQKMCDRGETLGYLEWTNDYPGSHLAPTEGTVDTNKPEVVWLETEEQYEQRINEIVNRHLAEEKRRLLRGASGLGGYR